MRLLLGAAAGVLTLAAGVANAQEREPITIAPQPLESALYEFGGKTGLQVLFAPGLAVTKRTSGISGETDVQQAMARLLEGTGLAYRRNGDMFVIVQQGEGGSIPQGASADEGAVEALIVTAQKKEEQIQDVPIAISAFTQKSLDAQKIEGGFDLLKAIPNVTFSKSNFSGYNFSIRGIGTKAVSATTDPAVAVSFNNTTLIVNRLFEQEYFDVERVEVLRGPQGTLFGRNATSGVINVISARPRIGEFEADLKLEAGNYNAQRARGMLNIPLGDSLAIRAAGAMTKRDGYGFNEAASDPLVLNEELREDVDGRDLWSARVTVGWEPIEQIRANLLWERFEEDDNRVRTSKQLCHRDPGASEIAGVDVSGRLVIERALTSQGCMAGSLYDQGAFGTPNGASLPYIAGLFWGPSIGSSGVAAPGEPLWGLGYNPYYTFPSGPNAGFSDGFRTPALEAECAAQGFTEFYSPINVCQPDPYAGQVQSSDLRTIHSQIEPTYRAKADIFELSVDLDLTDSLTLTSQTVYSQDEYYASQDYNRYATFPVFNDSSLACGTSAGLDIFGKYAQVRDCRPGDPDFLYAGGFYDVLPGGVFTDPQLGPSSTLVAQDLSQSSSEQFNQEFRIASNYDAPFNFSMGANFTHFETMNDYFVFLNAATLLTHFFPFNTDRFNYRCNGPTVDFPTAPTSRECVYVDPNPLDSINGEGHNYFRSANPYKLTSSALFGELYWQATETIKVTAGLRMTWDRKVFTPIPSQLLLYDYRIYVPLGSGPDECTFRETCQLAGTGVNGRGSPPEPDIVQEWREPTGRLIVDWKPILDFTDETMVYASYSHGYKGGGANPPSIGGPAGILAAKASGRAAPKTFDPEFIDAFEVGTKNTLMGGALVLNASTFFYDYKGYQVSKILDRSANNENFDARVFGFEAEWIYSPMRNLRFNGTFGALRTRIADGETSIDLMDRAAGGNTPWTASDGTTYENWMVIKPWLTNSSNCIVPTELAAMYGGNLLGLWALCPSGNLVGRSISIDDGSPSDFHATGMDPDFTWTPRLDAPSGGAGFAKELGGNDLPNAPHWTTSLGAQYKMELPAGWDATLRGDFYWQSQSFARVYNTQYDKLRAWTNANISLWVENPEWGVTAEVYVKNAFDETPITDAFLNSDDSGLTTNVFTLDPRLIGVSVRKSF